MIYYETTEDSEIIYTECHHDAIEHRLRSTMIKERLNYLKEQGYLVIHILTWIKEKHIYE
tara:strand:+ start:3956 stop:4135 length:180 start_codon:yes stop_codon:yes gene_type:complete